MERLEGSVFPQAELVLEESQNLLERGGQLAASESSQELSQCLRLRGCQWRAPYYCRLYHVSAVLLRPSITLTHGSQ